MLHELPDGFLPEIIEALFHIAQPQISSKLHRAPISKLRIQEASEQGGLAAAVDPYQAHFFTLSDRKTYILKNIVDTETFFQSVHGH